MPEITGNFTLSNRASNFKLQFKSTHPSDRFFDTDARPSREIQSWTVIAEKNWLKPQLFYNFFVLKLFLIVLTKH